MDPNSPPSACSSNVQHLLHLQQAIAQTLVSASTPDHLIQPFQHPFFNPPSTITTTMKGPCPSALIKGEPWILRKAYLRPELINPPFDDMCMLKEGDEEVSPPYLPSIEDLQGFSPQVVAYVEEWMNTLPPSSQELLPRERDFLYLADLVPILPQSREIYMLTLTPTKLHFEIQAPALAILNVPIRVKQLEIRGIAGKDLNTSVHFSEISIRPKDRDSYVWEMGKFLALDELTPWAANKELHGYPPLLLI
uniref:Uncharacterized protein n=1 Tax=Chenopodium quinoa TaxID=63459 RepID=A0A803KPQ5_CHEQI